MTVDPPEGAHVFAATLVGKDRTQQAFLVLDSSGLTICKNGGGASKPDVSDAIAKVAFQFVYKLCKAAKRSRNAGSPRMLDVVIRSNQGLRELRVDLGSASKVERVMEAFKAMVDTLAATTEAPAAPQLAPASSYMNTALVRVSPEAVALYSSRVAVHAWFLCTAGASTHAQARAQCIPVMARRRSMESCMTDTAVAAADTALGCAGRRAHATVGPVCEPVRCRRRLAAHVGHARQPLPALRPAWGRVWHVRLSAGARGHGPGPGRGAGLAVRSGAVAVRSSGGHSEGAAPRRVRC
jgi:hypothetical protein